MRHSKKNRLRPAFLTLIGMGMVMGALSGPGWAQRASVSAAEVTGTFEHKFTGKYKGTSSEIKIASAGRGKLHVAMSLIYPYMYGKDPIANTGELDGEATITGDTAIYRSTEFGTCNIEIKFVRAGLIKVTQEGSDADCGFGHNVYADGTYTRTSSKKPKF